MSLIPLAGSFSFSVFFTLSLSDALSLFSLFPSCCLSQSPSLALDLCVIDRVRKRFSHDKMFFVFVLYSSVKDKMRRKFM